MKTMLEKDHARTELLGSTPGHVELRYPRRVGRRLQPDLIALATSLGWSEAEKQHLKYVYGSALAFDQKLDVELLVKPKKAR